MRENVFVIAVKDNCGVEEMPLMVLKGGYVGEGSGNEEKF